MTSTEFPLTVSLLIKHPGFENKGNDQNKWKDRNSHKKKKNDLFLSMKLSYHFGYRKKKWKKKKTTTRKKKKKHTILEAVVSSVFKKKIAVFVFPLQAYWPANAIGDKNINKTTKT